MTYVFKLKQQTCLGVDVFCVPYKNNTNGQLVINLASMSYNYLCDWLVMMNLIEMNNIINCNEHDMSQMTCQMLLKVILWCSVLQEDFECRTHILVPHIETRSQKSFMVKLRKNTSCSASNLNM